MTYFKLAAAVLMAAIVLALQMGWLTPGDAMFAAVAIAVLYTGSLLKAREGQPWGAAFRAIFTDPRSYPDRAQYYSYLASSGLALLVVVQAFLVA